jgi:hypothetical protein
MRTLLENISPNKTQGTGPNPKEYAIMKNIMRIIDISLNVVIAFSCILIVIQNAKPTKHRYVITAEYINNIRRALLSIIIIVTLSYIDIIPMFQAVS